jgi:hypothetical protein
MCEEMGKMVRTGLACADGMATSSSMDYAE